MFADNTAWDGGGARFCFFTGAYAEPAIRWNAFLDNDAYAYGGGVNVYDADPVLENCTFDGNSAGTMGGGVYAGGGVPPPVRETTLLKCIVTNSSAGGGVARENVTLTTSTCDVWGNSGGDYINCAPSPTDMSNDPLFCDPVARDLTLRDDSPCLPENNPWSVLIGAHDAGGCGTSADDPDLAPSFRLLPPCPNPASGPVALVCELAEAAASVELTIHTVDGRLVRRLRSENGPPGRLELLWDAEDANGSPVASGVYLVRASAGGRPSYRGLVVLRGP